MTSPEYQAPTWVNADDPDFVEGVSPDLGAGYLNQLSGAVEDHGQRLGVVESDVTNLQATALDQADGDARYILQSNANGFAPAEATANALAALPFRANNVTTTGAAVGGVYALSVEDDTPLSFGLDTEVVPKAGGQFTGPVGVKTLPGWADFYAPIMGAASVGLEDQPTIDAHATRKDYVDNTVAAVRRLGLRLSTREKFSENAPLHPAPPTITHSTTQPLTSPRTISRVSSKFSRLGLVPAERTTGGTPYIVNSSVGDQNNATAWGWSCYLYGDDLVVRWRATPNADAKMQIWVDDQPLTSGPTTPTGVTLSVGGVYFTRIQFASVAQRKITVLWQNCGLYSWHIPPVHNVNPAQEERLKIACVGASFTAYTNYYTLFEAWPWQVSRMLGADVIQAGVGGSGYTVATRFDDAARVAAIAAWGPELIVIEGSGNDDGVAAATITAAAASCYAAYAAACPGVPIIVVGAMPRGDVGSLSSGRAVNLAAVKAAADAAPNVIGFIDPLGTVDPLPAYTSAAAYAAGARVSYLGAVWEARVVIASAPATFDETSWRQLSWMDGTGNTSATTGDGNRDLLIAADDTHPTVAGERVLATNIAREVRAILRASA